jgi:hypothetical protein
MEHTSQIGFQCVSLKFVGQIVQSRRDEMFIEPRGRGNLELRRSEIGFELGRFRSCGAEIALFGFCFYKHCIPPGTSGVDL